MNKFKLVGLLILANTLIFSQNLDQKKQQLEDLNKEIDQESLRIKEVEEKTQNTQLDIDNTRSKKSRADEKIKQLDMSKQSAKIELDITMNKLDLTNSELADLHKLCELEFNKLCLAHYLTTIYPERKVDATLLSTLIRQTAEEINSRENKLQDLEERKLYKSKVYEDIIWSRIVTDKKRKTYTSQVTQLNQQLTGFEQDRKRSEERIEELRQQAEALDELITKLQADIVTEDYSYLFTTAKLLWPAKGSVIKDFGEQKSDQYRVSLLNNGIDIGLELGSDVVAVDNGIVAFAEWYNGAGKLIVINHQNGFHTLYSHNSKLMVSKGDKVVRNQVIALSGMTGSVEIPCVHFELRKRGTPINPLDWLE